MSCPFKSRPKVNDLLNIHLLESILPIDAVDDLLLFETFADLLHPEGIGKSLICIPEGFLSKNIVQRFFKDKFEVFYPQQT